MLVNSDYLQKRPFLYQLVIVVVDNTDQKNSIS